MKEILDALTATSPLQGLKREVLAEGLKNNLIRIKKHQKDSILHFAGELCNTYEVILSGAVAVHRVDEDGNLLVVAEFMSDDVLGGNLMFSSNPYYPMEIIALKDSRIAEIDKSLLFSLLRSEPAFLLNYLGEVSDHTLLLGDRIKHYTKRTIRDSLFAYFEHEYKRQEANPIKLEISKKALAEKIGVERTSLSRELAKMRREGLIDFGRDWVRLLY